MVHQRWITVILTHVHTHIHKHSYTYKKSKLKSILSLSTTGGNGHVWMNVVPDLLLDLLLLLSQGCGGQAPHRRRGR